MFGFVLITLSITISYVYYPELSFLYLLWAVYTTKIKSAADRRYATKNLYGSAFRVYFFIRDISIRTCSLLVNEQCSVYCSAIRYQQKNVSINEL